jgi:hypothetical protein
MALLLTGYLNVAVATTITFDNYVSPTNNELANQFSQTGTSTSSPLPYVQTPTGGITGGAVTSYAGSEYRATSVYTPNEFDLSKQGLSVSLAMDVFYDAQFHPLAPGANAVRSFRLGLLDSQTSAFETFGNASAYIEGMYALDLNQMLLVARNVTTGPMTSITLAQLSISPDHWYHLDTTFQNQGSNEILYTGSFFDLGADGTTSPTSLATWSWSWANAPIASSSSLYAGFSLQSYGGITQGDNFSAPTPVPEPETYAMMLAGLGLLSILSRRKKQSS